MKLIKHVSAAIIALIDSTAKAATKTIPVIGETTFNSMSMVNDAVKAARKEQLREQLIDDAALVAANPDVDWSSINKAMEY